MSRARNRADGDFGDLDITNIGAVSLDSIKGDADANSSIAFSGSDVITFTTGGSTAFTANADQTVTFSGAISGTSATFNGGITVDNFTIDGTEIDLSSGAITLDSADDITLDAANNAIRLKSSGTEVGQISMASSNLTITSSVSDKDIIFQGSDGGSSITALTLDMSAAGAATFNSSATLGGGLQIADDNNIGSASDPDAISIGSDGDVTLTQDLELQHDGATLSFGANDDVVLTHVHDTGLLLNSTMAIQFNDASQFINAPSATVLDINATDEIELNATLIDINGNVEISGNLEVAGTSSQTISATTAVVPDASDGASLGTSSLEFSDLFLADGAVISLGDDDDVTLTHVPDEALLLNSTNQFRFGDSGTYIHQSADGVLDLVSDNEIELNGLLVDINANVEISGTTTQTGVSTSAAKDVFNAGMSIKNGSTSAGFVEFFEDSDNGTNKVTVIGPSSTSDVTLTLPSSAGTIATTATAADEATALAIALG